MFMFVVLLKKLYTVKVHNQVTGMTLMWRHCSEPAFMAQKFILHFLSFSDNEMVYANKTFVLESNNLVFNNMRRFKLSRSGSGIL